jgi:uncharacterized membrane protein HdeD (DUF308 family)
MDPRAVMLVLGVVLLLIGIGTWGTVEGSLPGVMTFLGAALTFFGVITIIRL